MQAKSRKNPTKPARPGAPERKELEYRRNGTACLFAALFTVKRFTTTLATFAGSVGKILPE